MSKHGKGKGKGPSVDIGTRGDDLLVGGPGKDLLLGLKGNDELRGAGGDDRLHGGKGNDLLDGGAGNDRVRGDSGNDRAVYTMANNLGARDEYDGGKGFDTLELRLTYGEYLLASVQRDLARFQAFLSHDDDHGHHHHKGHHHHNGHHHHKGHHHHDHHHGHGREFEFQSFNLDVKGFEALAVVLVNTGPTAVADSASIDEDHVLLGGGLLANDMDPDHLDVLKVVGADATSALGAVVTVNADGSYSYDATGVLALQALQAGESATDTFEYTIADLAGAQSSAVVTITITGVNDAPEAADDAFTLTEDELLSVNLLANDSDVEDDPLTVASAFPGVGADGSLQFDPRALAEYQALQEGESLQVSFGYTVDDGHGGSDTASVAITVTGVNDAPEAADDAYTMDEDSTLTIAGPGVLANDGDIEDDALSAILASGPAHGTLTLNADGSFSYTPNADFFGTDSFSYKANDGRADSDVATVSITVNDVAEKPSKVVDSLEPGAPLDYYIRFEGAGEDDWLHLGSFNLGFTSSATVGEGGGAAGKVSAQDLFAVLGSSDAIPKLLQTLATGKHVVEAEIEVYQLGGKPQLVDQYYFQDVLLKTLEVSGVDGLPGAESLSFEFARFNHSHAQLKADGSLGQAAESGWDFQQGKAFTGGPAHAGDALKAKVEEDTGGNLDYFVHFDGVDGWLRLQSMSVGFQQSGSLSGGGGGAGKASHTDAHMVLGLSEELLELSDALLKGKHFQSAQVEVYQAGGKQQLVDEYTFEDVLLTGLQTANATTHQLSFDFARYGHAHIGQKADGSADTPVLGGYDFQLGKAFTPDAPSAEGLKDKVPSIDPGATLDYYIRFEGAGEDDWLHLGSFSLGFASSGSVGDGGGAGKVSAQDLFSMLGSSDAIPKLLQTLATGKHVVEAEIEAYQQGAKQQLVDQYYFQDVLLTSLEVSGADGIPSVQSLSFEFDRFNHSHAQVKADGTLAPAVEAGWDFQAGKAFTGGPAHAGDALKANVEDDTGGNLDYFVHFDGVDGWLRLQSMSVGFQQSGSLGGGGGGAGKASHTDAQIVLGLSEELLELSDALLKGKHFQSAQIEVYQAGGKQQLVEEYTFEDVLLTGLQTSNATANSLSFDFARYGHAHIGQKADGSADTPVLGGYDFQLGKAFTPDAPSADGGSKDAVASLDPGATLDYYIRFEGAGEDDWLHLGSFSLGFASSGSVGDGGGAGKVSAQDLFSMLGSSDAIPKLLQTLATGKHVVEAEIEAYQQGGKQQLVDQYYFQDVLLTSLQVSGVDGTPGVQSLSFEFDRFHHSHAQVKADGTLAPAVEAGWDFQAGKAFTGGPAHTGDALKAKVEPDSGGSLEYFVRFDGVDGWLQLHSMSLGFQQSGSLSGGGGGAGKASHSDVFLLLGSSKELLELSDALFKGQHLKDAEIEVYRTGGDKRQLAEEYTFEDVLLTSFQTTDATINQISFDFARYGHAHIGQKADGTADTPVLGGYDFQLGKAFTPDAPVADIDFF